MTRAAVNAHPSVAPALRAWRLARAERDRVLFDRRHGDAARRRASRAADDAGAAYDRAVELLLTSAATAAKVPS